MKRLTKTYSDGTFGVADDLPCGENSYAFKQMLIKRLGELEQELEDEDLRDCMNCKFNQLEFTEYPCTVCDRDSSEWKDGRLND